MGLPEIWNFFVDWMKVLASHLPAVSIRLCTIWIHFRTRRGVSIRPFSSIDSIELACAVRQPGPCVRALLESGALLQRSHLKLRTSHCILHTSRFTLRICTSHLHFTLHTSSHLISSEHFSPHLTSSLLII